MPQNESIDQILEKIQENEEYSISSKEFRIILQYPELIVQKFVVDKILKFLQHKFGELEIEALVDLVNAKDWHSLPALESEVLNHFINLPIHGGVFQEGLERYPELVTILPLSINNSAVEHFDLFKVISILSNIEGSRLIIDDSSIRAAILSRVNDIVSFLRMKEHFVYNPRELSAYGHHIAYYWESLPIIATIPYLIEHPDIKNVLLEAADYLAENIGSDHWIEFEQKSVAEAVLHVKYLTLQPIIQITLVYVMNKMELTDENLGESEFGNHMEVLYEIPLIQHYLYKIAKLADRKQFRTTTESDTASYAECLLSTSHPEIVAIALYDYPEIFYTGPIQDALKERIGDIVGMIESENYHRIYSTIWDLLYIPDIFRHPRINAAIQSRVGHFMNSFMSDDHEEIRKILLGEIPSYRRAPLARRYREQRNVAIENLADAACYARELEQLPENLDVMIRQAPTKYKLSAAGTFGRQIEASTDIVLNVIEEIVQQYNQQYHQGAACNIDFQQISEVQSTSESWTALLDKEVEAKLEGAKSKPSPLLFMKDLLEQTSKLRKKMDSFKVKHEWNTMLQKLADGAVEYSTSRGDLQNTIKICSNLDIVPSEEVLKKMGEQLEISENEILEISSLEQASRVKEEMLLENHNGCVDLRPLWQTNDGFALLRGIKMWLFCSVDEFDAIRNECERKFISVRLVTLTDSDEEDFSGIAGDERTEQHETTEEGLQLKMLSLPSSHYEHNKLSGWIELLSKSGITDAADVLWRSIPTISSISFINDTTHFEEIEIHAYLGLELDEERQSYECEEEVPLESLIRALGNVRTSKSVKYLGELLEARWQSNVYSWAKIAGGYSMTSEGAGFVMANVLLWVLSALEGFHNESVIEPLWEILRRVIRKTNSPVSYRMHAYGTHIDIPDYVYKELFRSMVGIVSCYDEKSMLKVIASDLESEGRLSPSLRKSLVEIISDAIRGM